MYIKRIHLQSVRALKSLDLDICDANGRPRMRTAIIGMNGTCKTSILRCIAMGLCGQADANALLAEPIGKLVNESEKSAKIEIELEDKKNSRNNVVIKTELTSQKGKETIISQKPNVEKFSNIFVVGYGIGVAHEGSEPFREYRVLDSVYSLFNYDSELIPAELTLRRLKDFLGEKIYENTITGIKRALGLPETVRFKYPRGGGVIISGPSIGQNIPLEGWADGYRITFSWILDLYAWAMRANAVTRNGGVKGILLIDELEKHIHPSLQSNVLIRLQELWPDLQVFGTTHSPLVMLGAEPDDVVVLRRENGGVVAQSSVPNFTGFSAEDVLRDDDLFDTDVYAPETNLKFQELEKLSKIKKESRTTAQTKKLKKLTDELRAQQLLLLEETPLQSELKELRNELGLTKRK